MLPAMLLHIAVRLLCRDKSSTYCSSASWHPLALMQARRRSAGPPLSLVRASASCRFVGHQRKLAPQRLTQSLTTTTSIAHRLSSRLEGEVFAFTWSYDDLQSVTTIGSRVRMQASIVCTSTGPSRASYNSKDIHSRAAKYEEAA
eukprot:8497502-Pyramimonas_sp.AAC.1